VLYDSLCFIKLEYLYYICDVMATNKLRFVNRVVLVTGAGNGAFLWTFLGQVFWLMLYYIILY